MIYRYISSSNSNFKTKQKINLILDNTIWSAIFAFSEEFCSLVKIYRLFKIMGCRRVFLWLCSCGGQVLKMCRHTLICLQWCRTPLHCIHWEVGSKISIKQTVRWSACKLNMLIKLRSDGYETPFLGKKVNQEEFPLIFLFFCVPYLPNKHGVTVGGHSPNLNLKVKDVSHQWEGCWFYIVFKLCLL